MMGIEEFYPISRPKILKSPAKIKALPEDKKLVLQAGDNKAKEMEEYTQE